MILACFVRARFQHLLIFGAFSATVHGRTAREGRGSDRAEDDSSGGGWRRDHRQQWPRGGVSAAVSADVYRCLLIPRRRIFDSSVWRGIPSLLAAPEGPDTRP